jgi:serpin B
VTQPSAPEIRSPDESEPVAEEEEEVVSPSFFSSPQPRDVEPPTREQASAFAESSNAFGFAIYGAARGDAEGNFAISPASITLAFDMVYGGARGETAAEMARVMGISGDPAEVHDAAGRVLARWNDPDREAYELRVVNRLFGEQTFRFEQDYLTLTRTEYAAPFEGVDFLNDPDTQRVHINQWVADQTAERINDLLPPPAITSDTRLVLVNAVYFLGTWVEQFDPDDTADEPFTMADGSTANVPLMRQTTRLKHARLDGVTVVELPYRGGQPGAPDLVMDLIIPDEPSGLDAVESRLSNEVFSRWVAAPRPGQVRIVMPRFEMKAKLTLADHLKSLGMRLAFDETAADFTGIGRPPEPDMRLYISQAFHQTFVKVDEEGTEAAAATAVVMALGGGPPPEPIEIRADQPFLFAIREPRSNTILFMGRVVDPR